MPLRMAIDEGSVAPADVALVGARDLDPPELDYLARHGIDDDLGRALDGADAVYVAFDVDVLEPGAIPASCHRRAGRPSRTPSGRSSRSQAGATLPGMGFTGLVPGADPAILARLAAVAGL